MDDLNDIFGYKIYKPPPEQDMPIISDLNCYGEVVTLIDQNADVIKDPVIQNIFKNLDGERTVKIEDLPPDVRYEGWNKKANFDRQVIPRTIGQSQNNLMPRQPIVSQVPLKSNQNNDEYQMEALRAAQMQAQQKMNQEQQMMKQMQQTRLQLEKEIHKQLVEQLTLRAQKRSASPEHQAQIEKLYGDLKLINPQLAMATMKASAELEGIDMNDFAQPVLRAPQNTQQIRHTYNPNMPPPVMLSAPRQEIRQEIKQDVRQEMRQEYQADKREERFEERREERYEERREESSRREHKSKSSKKSSRR